MFKNQNSHFDFDCGDYNNVLIKTYLYGYIINN